MYTTAAKRTIIVTIERQEVIFNALFLACGICAQTTIFIVILVGAKGDCSAIKFETRKPLIFYPKQFYLISLSQVRLAHSSEQFRRHGHG
jgi:hypothetical protein